MFRREENLLGEIKRRILPPAVMVIFVKALHAALLEIAFQAEHLPDPALGHGNVRRAAEIPCRPGQVAGGADAESEAVRDLRLAGEVIAGLRCGDGVIHDGGLESAAFVRLENFKRDLERDVLREVFQEFSADVQRSPAPVVGAENNFDVRIHLVHGAFDRIEKRRIIAAGIPAGTRTRIRNAVHDAVPVAFSRGRRIFAGKFQRLSDQADRARLRITAGKIAVNGIEELLRVRIVGMLVAADVIVEHNVDPVFGSAFDQFIDVAVAARCRVNILHENVDGIESGMQNRVELPVRKIVNPGAGVDAPHPGERRTGIRAFRQIRRFPQVHAVLDMNRAVKNSALSGGADEHAVFPAGEEKGTLFPRNIRRRGRKIVLQRQKNGFRLFLHGGQRFDADGDPHADKEIILQIAGRLPDHLRRAFFHCDAPSGINDGFPFARLQLVIAAVRLVNLTHSAEKIVIFFHFHMNESLLRWFVFRENIIPPVQNQGEDMEKIPESADGKTIRALINYSARIIFSRPSRKGEFSGKAALCQAFLFALNFLR